MEQTRLDTYHEILDEQGISNPNLFEYFFYNDIADWKFLGNTAASSVKGIWNEFDEKIINGTTEDRAEAGGEIFFNAICAAFAAEYLSKKKNPNTSVDDLADDIKPLENSKPDVVDDIIDKADDVAESGFEVTLEDGLGIRNRQGQPVIATDKTLDMALDPETYVKAIVEKYNINLRGSGQDIIIKYNPNLKSGIYGRTTAANPNVIEIGPNALMSEAELANTIAHELNHARDFIRGGIAPESSAYCAGDALSDYINGGR